MATTKPTEPAKPSDATADAALLVNVLSKADRANIQFVTMPVEEPSWDPNRRIASA